jgi:membrane-bound ClpP family serine protease
VKDLLVTVVIAVIVFEVLEHVVVPLVGLVIARKRKSASDKTVPAGAVVEVREWKDTEGLVFMRGELWKATSTGSLQPGDRAVVRRREGLTLIVEPLSQRPPR